MTDPRPGYRLEWRTVTVALDASGDGSGSIALSALPTGATALVGLRAFTDAAAASGMQSFDAVTVTQAGGVTLARGALSAAAGTVDQFYPLVPDTAVDVAVSVAGVAVPSVTAFVSLQFLSPDPQVL